MISVGDKVSDFELKDHHGGMFRLSEHRGKKVLLSFHPLAWTPVCSEQMKKLEEYSAQLLELNVMPVGVSVEPFPSKRAWAKSLGLSNVLTLSDFWPHGELAKKLGIFRESDGFSERANILLDEGGRVIFLKVYPLSKVPDFEEIIRFLRENR